MSAAPRVLLMVTGGIAAYKSCFLTRLLVQAGFSVRVAMTEAATRFVTPMTLRVLSGQPVATDLWGEGQSDPLDHIEYARWADLVVVAPATANTMAKAAQGIADEIVTTLLLAFPGPVLMAPAMNDNMWRHPATRANVEILESRDVRLVGPGKGWLACGTVDEGRMAEPEEILNEIRRMAAELPGSPAPVPLSRSPWAGRRVVITAGPTHEPIDPVRYVANRSSGAMGYALAAAAVEAGALVTLVSGPSDLNTPRGLDGFVPVETAREMEKAVRRASAGADWLIMAAAVADYAPEPAGRKLKKSELGESWSLEMSRNPDILATVSAQVRAAGTRVVGFALETADVVAEAQRKLNEKGVDFIVANDPTAEGAGFGLVMHRVSLVGPGGVLWESDSLPKDELARQILDNLEAASRPGPDS